MSIISIPTPVLGSQLNVGHPIARGLKLYWMLNVGGGGMIPDLSGHGYHGTMVGNLSWANSPDGPAISSPGATDYIQGSDSSAYMFPQATAGQYAGTLSAMVIFAPTEFNNYYEYALSKQAAAGYGTFAFMGSAGGGIFYCYGMSSNQVDSPACSGVNLIDGNFHILIGTYDRLKVRLYADGVEQGSGTALSENLRYNATANYPFAGCGFPAGAYGGQGKYTCMAVWDRALTAAEVSELSKDSWCMFRREPIELWAGSVGAGAPPTGHPYYYREFANRSVA